MSTIILAIESSCDDCSAAIIKDGVILSNVTNTQEVHRNYGGVVPELAARNHDQYILPIVDTALKQAGVDKSQLKALAVTRGPGLLGSLIVGVSFVKGLASSLNIPIIEVNHMQAHVLAQFATPPVPSFPFLCLTVSGGHTQIVKVDNFLEMEVIGSTLDDAAGEAFDKTGKMLGLPYPAGPIIDKKAQLGQVKYEFPIPKIPGLNFSFSGVKTAIRYFLRDQTKENPRFIEENINDICASVQSHLVSILLSKIKRAARELNINTIALAGGVSANSELRKRFKAEGDKRNWECFIPEFQYCTDNAGMIAVVAHHKFLKGEFSDQSIAPAARMHF